MQLPLPSPAEIAQLPPDGGPGFNRLVFEPSPYLRQHATNPVDWWPWGEAAFEEARRLDRPVFLSVGYSTCHWCHVMNRESFSNPDVARRMNEAFINVKLDREERPDIDGVYMEVTQALTGSGGWPMTIVMTPEKEPFFAGTYFPRRSVPGRIGMMDLVPALSEAWREKRGEVVESARRITEAVAERHGGGESTAINAKLLPAADEQFLDQLDEVDGGFGGGRMKFPMPHYMLHLLQRHRRTGNDALRDAALLTLRRMREGGVCDHVGLGFHRYATDREWLLPHFEKMLYDNALLLMACAEAARAAPEPEPYRTVALEIAEYLGRDLAAPGEAFYSAEDADSEGEEGKFYVWTMAELEEALGKDDAAAFAARHRFQPEGNFFDESTGVKTGANIPHLKAGTLDADPRALLDNDANALRERLLAAREKRVRPHRDEKILADWNGLAIAGLARGGMLLGEERLVSMASAAAEWVLRELRRPDGRLHKRFAAGQAGAPPTIEDYAFLCWGLLELHGATLENRWLEEALALAAIMESDFADTKRGGYFQTAHDAEALIFRARDIHDGALPSGNAVAALCLLRLHRLTGDTAHRERLVALLEAFFHEVARNPLGHAFSLMVLDDLLAPSREIVLAGERGDEGLRALLAVVRKHAPHATVLLREPGDDAVARLAPFAEGHAPVDGKAAAYVCEDFACRLPVTDAAALGELLGAIP